LEEAAPSEDQAPADRLGEGDSFDPTRPKPQPISQPAISPLDALFMGDVDEEEADAGLADSLEDDDAIEDEDLEEDEV
jgi:hypothetical protein